LTGRALSCHVARLLWGMIFSKAGIDISGSCLK
jgi:hypothetical protein